MSLRPIVSAAALMVLPALLLTAAAAPASAVPMDTVVLQGLDHDEATLLVGKSPLQVPLGLLTTAWRGDFTTYWRVPGGYSVPLALGSHGILVDAVGAQLAAAQDAAAPAPGHAFDATLRSRVAAFQQAQGLTPDGVAGPTTLMQINRASGVAEPWLAGTAPAASAAAVAQRK